MTDRHVGYVVTLDREVREDDAEAIITAIRMIKGVIGVEPVLQSPDHHIAVMKAKRDIEDRLWTALRQPEKD